MEGDLKAAGPAHDTLAPPELGRVPEEWPHRPLSFGPLLTPVEAAQYLRLDEAGQHSPRSAVRTLDYWRQRGELKATKFARRVWYRREELDRFLERKTEK
jgi:hypothetical protein